MEQGLDTEVDKTIPAKAAPLPDNLSPQCIGREFVRCYYTLLHENPNKLHRFYLDQSTFIHGNQTDDAVECVTGQKAIHEKIMSLNFEDCRTKIKHVDSQATIADGVVVQVSGELSNAGQMPRRFMQTFVLGSQTPRKYYVHNDIFRYQDEVFGYEQDDVEEDEAQSIDSHEEVREEELGMSSSDEHAAPAYEETTNGNLSAEIHNEDFSELEYQEPVENDEHDDFQPKIEEEVRAETVDDASSEPKPEIMDDILDVEPEAPKGPKSWAMIAGSGSNNARAKIPQQASPTINKSTPEPKEAVSKKEAMFQPFNTEKESRPKSARSGNGRGNFVNRYQEREAPNNHQIFVGNLPSKTDHQDLENIFKDYGDVIHVRVTPNNFGFVVFDNENPVIDVLSAVKKGKKFFLFEQRLNVEEKKTAMNNNRGSRKQFNDRRGVSRGRRNVGARSFNDHNNISDLK